ncbi:MAG: RluA family pseudouridine synthase [Paludibacteraceae bacterium]|nr:RluA family pseudouridine synthase [Paludibacteraceae bacterium]
MFKAPRRKNFAKDRSQSLKVVEAAQLFEFLQKKIGSSRTAIKSLLQKRLVQVNGVVETKYDRMLQVGETVDVSFTGKKYTFAHPKISILYEDDALLVVNKKEGILSVPAPNHTLEDTVYKVMQTYVKRQNKQNALYTVHRIDRDTSGVLMFAKTPEVQQAIKIHWHDQDHRKVYYALVEGNVEKEEDTIESWLKEDPKSFIVHSCNYDNGGMYAVTKYKVVKRGNGRTLVKCEIPTGRKNQIRVHMQSIGHPIVGDVKYGAPQTSVKRLCLHATYLAIRNPMTGKIITFESPVPRIFYTVMR